MNQLTKGKFLHLLLYFSSFRIVDSVKKTFFTVAESGRGHPSRIHILVRRIQFFSRVPRVEDIKSLLWTEYKILKETSFRISIKIWSARRDLDRIKAQHDSKILALRRSIHYGNSLKQLLK